MNKTKVLSDKEKLLELNKNNLVSRWYSGIDIEYWTDTSGCECPDMCRCGRIVIESVKVDTPKLVKNILVELKLESPILKYCVERILSRLKRDDIEVHVTGGYYGEEFDGITVENDYIVECLRNLAKIDSDIEAIKFVLVYEYGFLLPELEECNKAYIDLIGKSSLVLPNLDYSRRLNRELIQQLKDYNGPIGVFLTTPNGLRLIDGYHRSTSFLQSDKKETQIVVLTKE